MHPIYLPVITFKRINSHTNVYLSPHDVFAHIFEILSSSCKNKFSRKNEGGGRKGYFEKWNSVTRVGVLEEEAS